MVVLPLGCVPELVLQQAVTGELVLAKALELEQELQRRLLPARETHNRMPGQTTVHTCGVLATCLLLAQCQPWSLGMGPSSPALGSLPRLLTRWVLGAPSSEEKLGTALFI
jgi:hypothetical protein